MDLSNLSQEGMTFLSFHGQLIPWPHYRSRWKWETDIIVREQSPAYLSESMAEAPQLESPPAQYLSGSMEAIQKQTWMDSHAPKLSASRKHAKQEWPQTKGDSGNRMRNNS